MKKRYSKQEHKILDLITTFCSNCPRREECPEDTDCVLYKIEAVITQEGEQKS